MIQAAFFVCDGEPPAVHVSQVLAALANAKRNRKHRQDYGITRTAGSQ
ncbi:MAG: hypothetical protein RIQ93_3309 [Verrucomicrobiota bacterium]|jgi:hypothetical protein